MYHQVAGILEVHDLPTRRLYSSAHFNDSFPEHSDPEVLRTPLEAVVLVMKAMGVDKVRQALPAVVLLLGHVPPVGLGVSAASEVLMRQVVNFPFPTRPDGEALAAAEGCLRALGALDTAGSLTDLGRAMAVLPLHPRASRMILQVPPLCLQAPLPVPSVVETCPYPPQC